MSQTSTRAVFVVLFGLSTLWSRYGAAPPSNVLIVRGRTEPSLAIDPAHPSVVVGATNTNYDAPAGDLYAPGYFVSHNGGLSFSFGRMPMVRPYTTGADPTVVIDRHGTVFYSYLGETPSYCSQGKSAIVLTTSGDGGRSYRPPSIVDSSLSDDKPSLAVRSRGRQPTDVFLVWTRWQGGGSNIWYTRSTDAGRSFSRPLMLYSSRLDNFGAVTVVGPHGRVSVFWAVFPEMALSSAAPTQIWMRTSTDDGRDFGPARSVVGTFSGVPRMSQPDSLRNLTMPSVVDVKGVLYLSWAQVRHNLGGGRVDADIELARSSDGGATWSQPVRVNDASQGDRFMPSLSAFPDGSVGIAFYDRRRGASQLDVYAAHAWYARYLHVSKNIRVDQRDSTIADIHYIPPGSTCFSPGRFFGDYIGTAPAPEDALAVAWTDTQLHTYQETDIWFARCQLPAILLPSRTQVSLDSSGAPRAQAGRLKP